MKSPVVAYSNNTEKIMYQTRFLASALIVVVAAPQGHISFFDLLDKFIKRLLVDLAK